MHTRQLQRRDIPSITNISYHAWLDDELNEYVWPHRRQYPDDYHFERLFSARQKLVSPGFVGTVVVADAQDVAPSGPYEGEVMGYSWFERLPHGDCYDAKNTPMSATLDRPVAEAQRLHDLALNTGPIATLERYSLMIEKRYNELANLNSRAADPHNRAQLFAYFAADKALARLPSHWHVRLLGCHPRYEGRGVGSCLMEYGKQLAQRSGVPLSLTSAEGRALGMYTKKHGMRIVDWMDIPGKTFVGGAYCVYDPWQVWVKELAGESKNLMGRPLTGQWAVGTRYRD